MSEQSYGTVEVLPTRIRTTPDALNPAVPAPPFADDGGLPLILKSTLAETDPELAKWRAAFAAETMFRYREAPHEPPLAELPPPPEPRPRPVPMTSLAPERLDAEAAQREDTRWNTAVTPLPNLPPDPYQQPARHARKRRWYLLWFR
jgi:hypothetical protein